MDRMIGVKCRLIGDHPWAGEHGTVERWENTIFGWRPVVRMENGEACFVMKPEHFRQVVDVVGGDRR